MNARLGRGATAWKASLAIVIASALALAGVLTTPTVSANNHEFGVGDFSIVSKPQNRDTYKIGETIEFAMDFNREVEVDGTIHLSMRVGSDDANVGWRPAS